MDLGGGRGRDLTFCHGCKWEYKGECPTKKRTRYGKLLAVLKFGVGSR